MKILNYREQKYQHMTTDEKGISEIKGWCADCGSEFLFTITKLRYPSRRCKSCQKPGKRVKSLHPLARYE